MADESTFLKRQALAYLEQHTVASLATYGPQGLWAAAVFYASDGFNLFFLSAGHTRHAQNIMANPWAAATIQENYLDWPEIMGVQMEGPIQQLVGQERRMAIAHYQKKYPFIKITGGAIQAALIKVNWYRLSPERFYFIDNGKGFGHRDEIDLP